MKKLFAAGLLCISLSACGTSDPDTSISASNAPDSSDMLSSRPAFTLASFSPTAGTCGIANAADWGMVGLQVEMMVTSLSCGNYYGNPEAYRTYRKVMADNSDIFGKATKAVAAQMGSGARGMARFDEQQTHLSNITSLSSVGFNQAAFCEPRRAWFDRMMSATKEEFTRYGSVVAPASCGSQGSSPTTVNAAVEAEIGQVAFRAQ